MGAPSVVRAKEKEGLQINVGRILAWLLLIVLIFITLFPLWWVLRTAMTTPRMIFVNAGSLLPVGFTLDNFMRVLGMMTTEQAVAAGGAGQALNFWLYLRNSFIVATSVVIGQVGFSALAAYAFARLRFPGRDKLFFIYITALMVPGIVVFIPNFILIRSLGWLNTFQGIVAPVFLMTPFAVFFLRQFFLGINHELEEAAKLDGASIAAIFWRVIVPISMPPLTTLAILTFIGTWNDYLWPFLVGQRESVRVLTVALGIFRSQTPQGAPDWGGLMAGTALSILPILVIYLILGRKAIDSIQFSGFK